MKTPAAAVIGFWFFYQILMSVFFTGNAGGVARIAHGGGFTFG
ncbi:MAG: hypothetical protein NTV06_00615 [candidate division Zixibacteria bacterium]|nr:hypothetical protein [candidate division Zixibacteria bacterium]